MIHHPWVDGAFDEHASNTAVPNIPPIVEIEHAYDNASNRLTARDVRPGSAQANRDSLYTYDGLDRLAKAERGVVTFNGTSGEWEVSSYSTGSQSWDLDMLGNWSGFGTDTTGDGAYTSANEQTNRYHNDVNELTGIDLDDDDTSDITLTYDDAGNLRERPINAGGAKERYTHDLWNRLVKVETYVSSTWYSIGEYEYFGNHWRSVKRADTNSDQTLDERRELYYSAGWQLLEERVDDDYVSNPGVNRHLQYLWGLRYIDDVIWHREDANGDGDFVDGGDARWWHLTDTQFSTVAILDDGANLAERVRYDAYGKALHHRWRDVDGDRDYDSADRTIIINIAFGPTNQIGQASYRAEADLDRDGDVDTADLSIADTNYESALAPGVLSNSTVKNTIGWDGYVFNPETTSSGGGGGLYTVRHRWYSVELGRWLERDPAGYMDILSMYHYVSNAPLTLGDPLGLDECKPGDCQVRIKDINLLSGQVFVYNHLDDDGDMILVADDFILETDDLGDIDNDLGEELMEHALKRMLAQLLGKGAASGMLGRLTNFPTADFAEGVVKGKLELRLMVRVDYEYRECVRDWYWKCIWPAVFVPAYDWVWDDEWEDGQRTIPVSFNINLSNSGMFMTTPSPEDMKNYVREIKDKLGRMRDRVNRELELRVGQALRKEFDCEIVE